MDKTCGIWLGRWKDREDSPYGIKWVKSKKLLGVYFGYGDMFSDNWSPVMEEFIQTLGAHSMRNLSMTGRAVISNVMAIPKLTYIGQFLHLPEQFLKLINKELFSFICAEKHECIKRETLYGDPPLGGIGLVCIKLKLRAFLICILSGYWLIVGSICQSEWNLQSIGLHCIIGIVILILHPIWGYTIYTPRFYKQCQLLFDDYMKNFGVNVNIKSLSVQVIYRNLLSNIVCPNIATKFPEKDFKPIWRAVND